MERKILFLFLTSFVTQSFNLPADICDGIELFDFLPHPDNCAQYILCLMGIPAIIDCEPDHIYNEYSKTCEPGYPETCDLFTTTTIYIPTTTTTTVTDEPVTTTTTEEFTTTSVPEEMTTTTEESTTTSISEETTTTVTDQPTTSTTQEPTAPPNICDGNYFKLIPNSDYCFKYYFCNSGTAIPLECLPDTIFCNESQGCIAGNWDTCEFYTTTESTTTSTFTDSPTTTTEESTTTQRPTGPPELCDGKDFLFVADPNYCFRFYFCMSGVADPHECGPNTIFSEQTQGCIDGDWDTCEFQTTTEYPTTTTSTATDEPITITTTTQSPTGPPEFCEGKEYLFVPDPTYCFRFYFCMFGVASPYECAPDKIFSEESQGCIDGDWLTCVFHTTTVTTIITDEPISTTTTEEPFTITTTTVDTTIDTERPSTTTTTVTDIPTTTTTEPGPEITTPSTTTTQRPIGPPELCIGNNFRFIPDPDYCFRYYLCIFGVALPGECDPDKIFSEKWSGCVLGDWGTCTPINPFVQLS